MAFLGTISWKLNIEIIENTILHFLKQTITKYCRSQGILYYSQRCWPLNVANCLAKMVKTLILSILTSHNSTNQHWNGFILQLSILLDSLITLLSLQADGVFTCWEMGPNKWRNCHFTTQFHRISNAVNLSTFHKFCYNCPDILSEWSTHST